MKKCFFLFSVVFLLAILPVSAANLPDAQPEWGNWQFQGGRLYQLDEDTGLAKIHWRIPQKNRMLYEFDVRYERGGVEDLHGGFGIQIFVDKPARGAAWGDGNSYLLWLNYDANPKGDSISPGLSAQIYKSSSNHKMELIQNISLRSLERYLVRENMRLIVPVKLLVDGNTGKAWIYDPLNMERRYVFQIAIDKPMMGNWVGLRTNGISLSFGR